jgi:hypothetical protein
MKTSLFAAAVLAAVAAFNISPAAAAQYGTPSTGTPHYEWQYHYTGHHPHYTGGWVLVK